jgi:hypothetical protein
MFYTGWRVVLISMGETGQFLHALTSAAAASARQF